MNKSNTKPLTGEWLRKAQDDEKAAQSLLRAKTSPSVVCFLSQQMAEKYLKAFLVESGLEAPKIHQLEKLLGLCKALKPDFAELDEEAVLLSEYYIETRYPGDWPDGFLEDDANGALAAALKIKDFVFKELGI